jgi:hypothetical protein
MLHLRLPREQVAEGLEAMQLASHTECGTIANATEGAQRIRAGNHDKGFSDWSCRILLWSPPRPGAGYRAGEGREEKESCWKSGGERNAPLC